MKIYDISQEILGCQVYPGDPVPEKKTLCSMEKGDLYNLTAFSMCAHNCECQKSSHKLNASQSSLIIV